MRKHRLTFGERKIIEGLPKDWLAFSLKKENETYKVKLLLRKKEQ